ncbi:MAG: U32 family peptidase, partial [Planctomycetes bacterium]|nr:U32 family peptidase [Planctomycetota bacterium]
MSAEVTSGKGPEGIDTGAILKARELELLAPARDLACGLAAITCGADAGYIGAGAFGARAGAANPLEDIRRLTEAAHLYRVRVYAAVNTLLTDAELEAALKLIDELYRAGVDALIVQDMGLLECPLPPLPLIASTQCHCESAAKVKFLEGVGFKRVILARELGLEEIRSIASQTSVELECFVHGALCVSYSGQCYMSLSRGGRSGNRGVCAQPCRERYRLLDEAGRERVGLSHLLSLKDLNLLESLDALVDAGIRSFKIEGRLKDAVYVRNSVGAYRRRLDEIIASRGLAPSSSGTATLDFEPDLAKSFQRGHTTYFLLGKDPEMDCRQSPKSRGEFVGEVVKLCADHFVLDRETSLISGDGICHSEEGGVLYGSFVNRSEGALIWPQKMAGLTLGTQVYRNFDKSFTDRIMSARSRRRIRVQMSLDVGDDEVSLHLRDEDGVTASLRLRAPCEKARDRSSLL